MEIFKVTGELRMSLEFEGLPSVNTHYNQHYRAQRTRNAEWRYEARRKAEQFIGFNSTPLIEHRALVVVNVRPPYEEVSDIHNIYIKPILDGFSDAGVWIDDEWAWVPMVVYQWDGIGTQGVRNHKRRVTRIDVYELHDLQKNGEAFLLPRGRERVIKL